MVSRILDNAEEMIKRIQEHTGMPQEEVLSKIHEKQEEYGGLLTEAGAAYSIAKEAGVDIGDETKPLPVNELKDGMMSVDVKGLVEGVSPLREFNKNGRQGNVFNIILRDESAPVNLAVWNKPELHKTVLPGQTIVVKNAYAKDRFGKPELNLGNLGSIVVSASTTSTHISPEKQLPRNLIKELEPGKNKSIRAAVVALYPPTIISVCPQCGKMVDSGSCGTCGSAGRRTLIMNAELDDGSGVVRSVFYRQNAEAFLGITGEQLHEDKALFNSKKKTILGEEKLFYGEVRESGERTEFVVRGFADFDVEEEIKGDIKM